MQTCTNGSHRSHAAALWNEQFLVNAHAIASLFTSLIGRSCGNVIVYFTSKYVAAPCQNCCCRRRRSCCCNCAAAPLVAPDARDAAQKSPNAPPSNITGLWIGIRKAVQTLAPNHQFPTLTPTPSPPRTPACAPFVAVADRHPSHNGSYQDDRNAALAPAKPSESGHQAHIGLHHICDQFAPDSTNAELWAICGRVLELADCSSTMHLCVYLCFFLWHDEWQREFVSSRRSCHWPSLYKRIAWSFRRSNMT